MTRLADKIAIVTGGSRGIGAAIAAAFAAEGARVVIASRKAGELEAAAKMINVKHPERVIPRVCHTGSPDAVCELVEWVSKELGVPGEQTQTIRDGSPPAALLALARDVDAALIVVGSRGLGAVRAALLGSFSTSVLADAPCPVVVVPPAVPGSALG